MRISPRSDKHRVPSSLTFFLPRSFGRCDQGDSTGGGSRMGEMCLKALAFFCSCSFRNDKCAAAFIACSKNSVSSNKECALLAVSATIRKASLFKIFWKFRIRCAAVRRNVALPPNSATTQLEPALAGESQNLTWTVPREQQVSPSVAGHWETDVPDTATAFRLFEATAHRHGDG